ncbi:hypothetical protein DSO57_1022319 [Entomophthora muscae]|uniref:Uncharacterized protein n=1 Tax=Entomophthora muscae TaxID=34485 RepID=A0ACC2SFX2_9FUNG|nr:hypothetical protein DSO57_1022319 [Entomophthora muscae]
MEAKDFPDNPKPAGLLKHLPGSKFSWDGPQPGKICPLLYCDPGFSSESLGELEDVGPGCQVCGIYPGWFLVWSTSPELGLGISSSADLAGECPSHLMVLLDNLPGEAHGLISTGESLVFSLTCNDVEFTLSAEGMNNHWYEDSWIPSFVEPVVLFPLDSMLLTPEALPRCTSWLVYSMLLIGLNTYLPQLSPIRSFWSLIQAVIPALHWMAS